MSLVAEQEMKSPGNAGFDALARRDSFARLHLQTEHTQALVAHWADIAGDDLVPPKASFDPAAVKASLPFLMIYEFISEDEIRFRLFGTGLRSAFRADLTGQNYLDYVPADQRRRTSERLYQALEHPCGVITRLVGPAAGEGVLGLYEAVGLPLLDATGQPSFTIHASFLIERGVRPYGSDSSRLSPNSAEFFDIGAGLPLVGALV